MMTDGARSPQFLFEGVGSRGDVVPLLSIAAEMVRRGYDCGLLANEHFRSEALGQGVAFTATTSRRRNFTGPEGYAVETYLFPELEGVRDYFQRPGAYDAGTVVVNLDRWAASDPFAEARRLRSVRLHLCPFKIRSVASPSWPLGANASGLLGETYRNYKLPALYRAFDTDPKVLARINGVRASVGLGAVSSAIYEQPHVALQAALFPRWFGPPAEDWPEMELLGFPLPSSSEPLPQRLLEFLERVPAPLVFTPGTSVGETEPFFDAAAHCCAELRLPGVFLSPFLPPSKQKLGPNIIHFEHVELEGLLRRAAGIVHHGGIGTTARALQAGVPQVISPSVFDQHDNGRRVERLGTGRVVARDRLSGGALAAAMRSLLEDATAEARSSRHRAAVGSAPAVEHCADLLEELAPRTAPMRSKRQRTVAAGACELMPSEPNVPPSGAMPPLAHRVILIIVWPEMGHVVGPLAMARRFEQDGARVVFAGAGFYRSRIEKAGFEFVDLSAPPGRSVEFSVFSSLPNRSSIVAAVDNLIAAFDFALERYAPALVLMDSLYSAFSLLPEARQLPWATYETDLPRELDLGALPAPLVTEVGGVPALDAGNRGAWARLLWHTYRRRRESKKLGQSFAYTMESYFPDALCAELRRRLGDRIEFERRSYFPPVAKGPRLVLCSRELDFEREKGSTLTYVGPCIDLGRATPANFPWAALPSGVDLVYCTLGTQSLREPRALAVLQAIVSAFSRLSDAFLVVVCPQQYAAQLSYAASRVMLTTEAPQLGLLGRASLCIHHGGFNTLKECALFGVPQIVVPLSHDQFRNAELVTRRGLGVRLGQRAIDVQSLLGVVERVRRSPDIRKRCRSLQALLERANLSKDLTNVVVELLEARRTARLAPPVMSDECQLHRAVYRHSGADDHFSRLVADLLETVRRFMLVPSDVRDASVKGELEQLRRHLEVFRVEFRSRHAELVRSQVSRQRLPELARCMPLGTTEAFHAELEAIRRGIGKELQALRRCMSALPLYGAAKTPTLTPRTEERPASVEHGRGANCRDLSGVAPIGGQI